MRCPYDLGGAATGSKPSASASGFVEIEEALPSTAQKLRVRIRHWRRRTWCAYPYALNRCL